MWPKTKCTGCNAGKYNTHNQDVKAENSVVPCNICVTYSVELFSLVCILYNNINIVNIIRSVSYGKKVLNLQF
jgi:hypothetical protein